MTTNTPEMTAQAPTQSVLGGPKPVTMEDIYRLVGALYLEIEVLRRQNQSLREQLAAHGATEE